MKPDHLKRHVNSTHLKIKNVKCTFCDMYFSDKYKAKVTPSVTFISEIETVKMFFFI